MSTTKMNQGERLASSRLSLTVNQANQLRKVGRLVKATALASLVLAAVTLLVARAESASAMNPRMGLRDDNASEDGMATGYQQSQPRAISRVRREANINKLQQLELNEQTIKRQLPDLIAQAHQDKQVERALLRMLINASLRSGLGGSGVNNHLPSSWQMDAGADSNLMDGELVPARLEQSRPTQDYGSASGGALDGVDLSSLMATINQFNAAQLQPLDQPLGNQQQSSYPVMDKREYIKPCSFNAISCVRTPFRKL